MSHITKTFNNRVEWLNNRVIGGSSASAIVGKNPYQSNRELWDMLVHRQDITEEGEQNEVQQYGSNAEDHIRNLFALEHPQYEVIPPNKDKIEIMVHNDYDWLTATLDGQLIEKATGKKGILEIKTQLLFGKNKEKWENGNIPDNYYIQVLHYMLVEPEFEFAVIHCRQRSLKLDGTVAINEVEYRIDRDKVTEDLDYLLNEEIKFWQSVVEKKMPPLSISF